MAVEYDTDEDDVDLEDMDFTGVTRMDSSWTRHDKKFWDYMAERKLVADAKRSTYAKNAARAAATARRAAHAAVDARWVAEDTYRGACKVACEERVADKLTELAKAQDESKEADNKMALWRQVFRGEPNPARHFVQAQGDYDDYQRRKRTLDEKRKEWRLAKYQLECEELHAMLDPVPLSH